jgi:hypothetical protein
VKTTHCVGPWQTIKNTSSWFPVEMAVETQLPARSADNFNIIWCGTKNNQTSKGAATNKNKSFY